MADLQHYEFVVAQRIEGKWRMRRVLTVIGYIAFAVAFLVLGLLTKLLVPLLALAAIFLWMLIFFTWRYTCPDYELTAVSGSLSFTIVYGNRTRRPRMEVELKQLQRIAPLDEDGRRVVERFAPELVYTAVSAMDAPDVYFAIWEDDQTRCVLYFEATEQLLKICRHYNAGNTVVTAVSR